jgi:hypothetical protein
MDSYYRSDKENVNLNRNFFPDFHPSEARNVKSIPLIVAFLLGKGHKKALGGGDMRLPRVWL